jgi:hypothetical protein
LVPPGATGDETTVDSESARRAAQLTETGDQPSGGDAAIVALATSDSEEVICPPGVAPGSSITRKDAAGKEVSVKCK